MTISIFPASTSEIGFADTTAIDAFSRLRVSSPTTLFDAQQEYGLDTLRVWDCAANGTYSSMSSDGSAVNGSNAVGPTNSDTRRTPITVSTTNGHYSILQSRQYIRYIPGKSHLVLMTGVFASGSGASAAIVRRSSVSGSTVDSVIQQVDWNIDPLDGTGSSGVTIDFTKVQLLIIDAQWLGAGRVRVGFDINGVIVLAHEFLNANVIDVPYTQTFNLPVRYELRNTGAAESNARIGYFDESNGIFLQTTRAVAGGTIHLICASVQSEGGQETRGFPMTASNGTTSIGVTTRRAVLSVRPKTTYNGRTNRTHIELAEFFITAATNNSFFEIVIGGTLGGAPAWTSVGTNSVMEFDVAGTTVTGGTTVLSGYVLTGSGTVRNIATGDINIRNPLVLRQIDGLAANQDSISIVCTSIAGTSNILACLNWHEQTV